MDNRLPLPLFSGSALIMTCPIGAATGRAHWEIRSRHMRQTMNTLVCEGRGTKSRQTSPPTPSTDVFDLP